MNFVTNNTGQQGFCTTRINVSDVFLDAEFKYVSRIVLSPTPLPSDSESNDEAVGQANKNMDCDPIFVEACSSNADSRRPE